MSFPIGPDNGLSDRVGPSRSTVRWAQEKFTAVNQLSPQGTWARGSLICDNMVAPVEESQMSMMDGPSVDLPSARLTAANHRSLRAMRVLHSAVEHHSESLYAYKVLEAIGG
ncbi:unnamed protein product [Arctogadus glacialis]